MRAALDDLNGSVNLYNSVAELMLGHPAAHVLGRVLDIGCSIRPSSRNGRSDRDERGVVGQDPHHAVAGLDLLVDPLEGISGPDLGSVRGRTR